MIEFQCKQRDETGTPIIRNEEVWSYAEALVKDYKPELLRKPGAINATHFVETYLGAAVGYQNIYYKLKEDQIAGATVFNDDFIAVFDKDRKQSIIPVKANTILLDEETIGERGKGFEKFTLLHEGGHYTMHGQVYRRKPKRINPPAETASASVIKCCRSAIYTFPQKGQRWTSEQWREHQANNFAAFVAMPRPTFIPYVQDRIKALGFKSGTYVLNTEFEFCSDEPLLGIVRMIASTFGVSRIAVLIHMRRLGLLLSKEEAFNNT